MSAIVSSSHATPAISVTGLLPKVRSAEPRFFATAILMLLVMAPTGFAAFVDSRELLGVDIWLKPLKFEFALLIYLGTLAVFALFIPAETKARTWYLLFTSAVSVGSVLEIIWLGGASAIGAASHFNPTPVGQVLYPLAGLTATLISSASTVYAVQIARNPSTGLSPALKVAIVLGLALVLPLTLITAGTMSQMDSHFIGGGGASDAGGFPFMGWSRDGGDLRVAHFFATHALHFVPAFGLVSAALLGRSNVLPVRIFAAAFAAFVLFLFAQALMGVPFLPSVG
jgi:hypothetical protein